jgi:hypothetical protein
MVQVQGTLERERLLLLLSGRAARMDVRELLRANAGWLIFKTKAYERSNPGIIGKIP